MGTEIRNYEMKSYKLIIDRNGLTEGIYSLKIRVDNNFITKKLIISN